MIATVAQGGWPNYIKAIVAIIWKSLFLLIHFQLFRIAFRITQLHIYEQLRRYSLLTTHHFICFMDWFHSQNQKWLSRLRFYQLAIFSSRKSQPFQIRRKWFTPYLKSAKFKSRAKNKSHTTSSFCFVQKIIKSDNYVFPTAQKHKGLHAAFEL